MKLNQVHKGTNSNVTRCRLYLNPMFMVGRLVDGEKNEKKLLTKHNANSINV